MSKTITRTKKPKIVAERKLADKERYDKMSRRELQQEMAKVITGSIMKLVEQVVEKRVHQWVDAVAEMIEEKEKLV